MADSAIAHAEITYRIIGAAMRVHRRTTRGLREQHYQKALTAELLKAGLSCLDEHHARLGLTCDVVVTDGVRYRFYAADRDFAPVAYANLARLKQPALELFARLTQP